MKGIAVYLYIPAVLFVGIIFISSMVLFNWRDPKTGKEEIMIKEQAILQRDSLELAKIYIDNAARYSAFQAMYDNGRLGGVGETGGEKRFEHSGTEYVLWFNNTNMAPGVAHITQALEEQMQKNMLGYTQGKTIQSIFEVSLPAYDEFVFQDFKDLGVRVLGRGSKQLSLRKKTENGEDVSVSRPSDISIALDVPYYDLYWQAMGEHALLEEKLYDCDKSDIAHEFESPCCTGNVEVLDTDDGSCLALVTVTTRQEYLIWDKDEGKARLDKISIISLARLGTLVERCSLCLADAGDWCVQSEKCATGSTYLRCPGNSTITTSCHALEHESCSECLTFGADYGELWVWCPDPSEAVCADNCIGRTFYNAEECLV